MVYYRKYRPQSLIEVIGQDQVKSVLQSAFTNDKLAHAYLFCGPRGTGKTSTARILAKLVNCESTDSNKPCNTCSSCLSITDGSHLDLVEIDAASNRGIDDIRELRERVKLSPSNGKKKIYIIDEVHMLTNEAFNALLKTLEEPPSHVLFILATTEFHKIPQTILSRVQKLDFTLASPKDLQEALKRVIEAEKLEVEEDALMMIAQRAEGSFRDGLKLLDQIASAGEKVTLSQVEQLTKAGQFTDIVNLLTLISSKDAAAALKLIDGLVTQGVNIKEFTQRVLEVLRAILFIHNGALNAVETEFNESQVSLIKKLSESYSLELTFKTINLFLESVEKMKFASIPSLPLEIAVVESCGAIVVKEAVPIAETVSVVMSAPAPIVTNLVVEQPEVMIPIEASTKDDVQTPDLLLLRDKWQFVLETIKPYNYSLEALLKQAQLKSVNEGIVLLEVPYSFHQRILEAPKSRDLLESVLSDVLSKTMKVSCILGKRPVRVEEIANVELAADDEIIKVAAEIFNSDSVN